MRAGFGVSMEVWRKIREDGSTGLLALLAGVAAVLRGGRTVPEVVRLRWRLRDTRAELAAARADLGAYLASSLSARRTVEVTDEQALRGCQRIESLLAEERRLLDALAGKSES